VEHEPVLGQPCGPERRAPRRRVELVRAQHVGPSHPAEQDALGLVLTQMSAQLDRHEAGTVIVRTFSDFGVVIFDCPR
jgi:hypothetical protein